MPPSPLPPASSVYNLSSSTPSLFLLFSHQTPSSLFSPIHMGSIATLWFRFSSLLHYFLNTATRSRRLSSRLAVLPSCTISFYRAVLVSHIDDYGGSVTNMCSSLSSLIAAVPTLVCYVRLSPIRCVPRAYTSISEGRKAQMSCRQNNMNNACRTGLQRTRLVPPKLLATDLRLAHGFPVGSCT